MTSTLEGHPPVEAAGGECAPVGLRERKKADKRSRIMATAARLFAERGYEAVTTAELARQAGVGVGTLFRYAGSKSELLVTILNERLRDGVDVGLRMAREGLAPVDALMAVFTPLIDECRGHTGNAMAYERAVLFGSGPESARAFDQLAEMEATVVGILACRAPDRPAVPAQSGGGHVSCGPASFGRRVCEEATNDVLPPGPFHPGQPATGRPIDDADLARLAHAVVGAVYLDVVRACRDPELVCGLACRVRGSLEFLLRGVADRPAAPAVS